MTEEKREDPTWEMAMEYSKKHITVCNCNGAGFVRLNVPVGHPLFGKAIPCVCARDGMARKKAEALRKMCRMNDWQWENWRFETFNPDFCEPESAREAMRSVYETCKKYARRPEGWLYLTGGYGAGKSHLAYAIARDVIRQGKPAVAITLADLLGTLREAINFGNFEEVFRDISDVYLLVLDDVGAERGTEWGTELFYRLINYRYMQRLPTVFTSNFDITHFDARISSRLSEGTLSGAPFCRVLNVPASDFRPRKVWKGANLTK